MKKIVLLLVGLCFAFVGNAQWKVQVEDDGFDDKSYVATALSKDGNARITLALVEQGMVIGVSVPDIIFRDSTNDVDITFKVKGENKTYNIIGCASRGSNGYIILAPKNGSIKNIGELMSDEFVADFKNASAMKMKVSYSVPYRGTSYKSHEEYVFNMTGSANAYNRVSLQK